MTSRVGSRSPLLLRAWSVRDHAVGEIDVVQQGLSLLQALTNSVEQERGRSACWRTLCDLQGRHLCRPCSMRCSQIIRLRAPSQPSSSGKLIG